MDAQQAHEAEQKAGGEQPPARGHLVTWSQQKTADHQHMAGDRLAQGAAAEIDELGGDGDKGGGGERAGEAKPAARPPKAAKHGRARQHGETRCDDRQVVIGPITDETRYFHQPGHCARQHPGPHAELEFPRHQPVAVDQAVRRFGRLEDLVPPIQAGLDQDRHQPQSDRRQHQQRETGGGELPLLGPTHG